MPGPWKSKDNDKRRQSTTNVWAGQAEGRACDQGVCGRLNRPYKPRLIDGQAIRPDASTRCQGGVVCDRGPSDLDQVRQESTRCSETMQNDDIYCKRLR